MVSEIGFIDILVSEVTMVISVMVFFLCGFLLIFRRKAMGSSQKALTAAALIITGIYLAVIIGLVFLWGQQIPEPTPYFMP